MSLKDNVDKIDRRLQWGIFLLATGIGCAFTAMVYAHSTFITKDVFELVVRKLDRIEQKLDNLRRLK